LNSVSRWKISFNAIRASGADNSEVTLQENEINDGLSLKQAY
jgi:hypothetical protein